MADEVTSHGKEILAVCVRFLEVDHSDFQTKPHKHEALVDFCFLTRITGESIAESILKVIENHQINIKNCRGQAYDTTSIASNFSKCLTRTSHTHQLNRASYYNSIS